GVGPHRLFEREDRLLASDEEGRDHVRKYDSVAQRQHRIGPGFTWRKRWAWLCSGHGRESVLLSLSFIRSRNLGHYRPKCGPKQDRNFNSLFGRENSLFFAENFLFTPKNFPACSTGRSNFVTAWLYQSSRAIGISHIRHDQAIGPDDTRQRIDGLNACPVGTSTWCLGFVFGGKVHVRPARSIFSNALNFCCSAIAALVRSP